MAIFNSYVSLPEGNDWFPVDFQWIFRMMYDDVSLPEGTTCYNPLKFHEESIKHPRLINPPMKIINRLQQKNHTSTRKIPLKHHQIPKKSMTFPP